MDREKGLFVTILALLLTSVLCLALYQYDNKYTHDGVQPINGVLFWEEDSSMTYLTRQWTLYPDVLLTPESLKNYDGYRTFADIGGENDHESADMSYHLALVLPEKADEYTIELPEVFSSCKMYVNDSLILSLGNTDPDGYIEGLSSKIVSFSGRGITDLLIVTSDRSGVNRGMIYPPAFGNTENVLAAREIRMLIHSTAVLMAALGALLSISFGLRSHFRRGLLSFLLCLSMAVVTGYPLYHGLFVTGTQPWYTLEPVCYYAILMLALMIQGIVYDISRKMRIIIALPCMLGLGFTLIRFSMASLLPSAAAEIFSAFSAVLKTYSAFAIAAMSFRALWKNKVRSPMMTCATASYAAALFWDRILPLYEPVFGGWFGELGSIFLVIALGVTLWTDAVDAFRFRLDNEMALVQMGERLAMQKEHYSQLSEQIKLARRAGHDLRHHMRAMRAMAEDGRYDKLQEYLIKYEPHAEKANITIWSDHYTADAVLSHYAKQAEKLNAEYDVRFAVPPDMAFPDDELCIILSNVLENAVEAVSRQSEGKRIIYLRGSVTDGRLCIAADNTYSGEVKIREDVFLSTKREGVGLGIGSVISIAEKYGGLADFSADDMFRVSIMIPLK